MKRTWKHNRKKAIIYIGRALTPKSIKSFLLANAGLLLVAAGIYFFKVPNNFSTGGVSGIAIIIRKFSPGISVGPLMMIINIILLLVGLLFIGFDFGSKTMYSSFALSGMVWALEHIYPMSRPFTGDALLELIFSILLPAVGSAILFNLNASTGGTDIIAKILSRHTNLNIGKTLLLSDFLITMAAGLVFGIRIWMYSVLGLIMKGFLIDLVIEGINLNKQMMIVSDRSYDIRNFVTHELKRGATVHKAVGAFTNEEKEVIITVVNRKQAIRLRNFTRQIDRKAFITITNTSEIIGKGFRNSDG